MKKALLVAMLLSASFAAHAQRSAAGTWEWSVAGLYQDSKNMGSENGSTLRVDGAVGLGFNVGYNLTDHFSLSGDFDFLRPDYSALLVEDSVGPAETLDINHKMYQFNGRLKANYNFMTGNFRPFVEAGLGWTYFDSNVIDGEPIVGCWWHPYWGYICDGFYNTFTETVFTYGVGAGFKYKLTGGSFVKFSVNQWFLDGVGAAGDEDLTAARIEYGWSF